MTPLVATVFFALAALPVEAAEVAVQAKAAGGALAIGERGTVSLLVLVDGAPATGTLVRADGVPVETTGAGRFSTDAVWTGAPWTMRGSLQTQDGVYPVEATMRLPALGTDLAWPARMVGTAGAREGVALDLTWPGQGAVDDIWVATGAGRIDFLRQEPGGLKVGVQVPPDPFPRAIPLLALDESSPGTNPELGILVLRARTQIPVRTTPGTIVTVEIGGRSLAPVVADEAGVASVGAWIRPGDTTARLRLEDPAGNVNTSTIRLGGDPRPHLVGLATPGQPGERAASVVIAATTASGSPWLGAPPRCNTPRGAELLLHQVKPGVWRGPVKDDERALGTVECHLGVDAQAVLRLPRIAPRPEGLVLRVSPPELDSAAPEATIRAWVVDARGDRLMVTPPELSVAHGALLDLPDGDANGLVQQAYDGVDAVSRGSDTVTARWSAPAGNGPIRDLDLRWGRTSDERWVARGRALDSQGQPLTGPGLVFELNDERVDGTVTEHGWASASFSAGEGPHWLTVRGVQSGRSVGAWVLKTDRLEDAPEGYDFTQEVVVPVMTGAVRRVALQASPARLVTTDGRTADVVLDLRDGTGSPVTDLPVALSASRGQLSEPRLRPDGRFEATYTPARPGDIGKVELTARSPGGHFPTTATELEMVAEDLRRAPGLHVGWLAGSSGVSSPWVSIDGEVPVAGLPDQLRLRLSAGLYGLRAAATDPATGQEIAVSADLVPLGVGIAARQLRGRFVGRAGASFLVVPYWVRVSMDTTRGVQGPAMAPPGLHAYAGTGLRTRNGELDLSMGYLLVTTRAGDGGWEGPAGGFLPTVGYRYAF